MPDKFCEHIQRGESRPYQRASVAGTDFYQCWNCAGNLNAIMGKFENLWEKLNRVANKQPDQKDGEPNTAPKLWTTTIV